MSPETFRERFGENTAKLRAPGAREEQGFLACQLDARDGPVGQLDNSCTSTRWAPLA